ncbi:hypothetical protein NVIRENTERO_03260 [Sodalis praecaptivus]|nr:hypothetical protein NVIRENTERO_03260 [Sodalis praecaptivus]
MRIAACTHTAQSAGIVHPPAAASSGAVKRLVHGLRAIDSAANHGANTLSYASAQASATLRQRLINRIIQMHPKTKGPKSCFRLAIKYGLSPQEFHVLEMKVVQGPAAKRLRRGESCDTLSRDYGGLGGLSYEARTRLEIIAVNGPAAQCLHRGASVSRVCRKWGIITQTHGKRCSAWRLPIKPRAISCLPRYTLSRSPSMPPLATRAPTVTAGLMTPLCEPHRSLLCGKKALTV